MSDLLSEYISNKHKNNFNLLRFFAVCLILISLSFTLKFGSQTLEPIQLTLGLSLLNIGIDIILISSGFLITQSYQKHKDTVAFIGARILSLLPQLVLAILVCIFAIGVYFTQYEHSAYFFNAQTATYLLKNTTLVFGTESSLPGVFNTNPVNTVNGNLWMLTYLVAMYGIIILVFKLTEIIGKYYPKLTAKNLVLLLTIDAVVLNLINHQEAVFSPVFVEFFAMFMIGCSFWLWRDKLRVSSSWLGISLPLLMAATLKPSEFYMVYCLTLPFILFYLAYLPIGKLKHLNSLGIFAYGIFLYVYPVQQCLIAMMPNITPLVLASVSLVISFALAVISQHFADRYTQLFKKILKRLARYCLVKLDHLLS